MPTWLTIELALIPVIILVLTAVFGGIIWAVRLEGKVKAAQKDASSALTEIEKVKDRQTEHHDRLYGKLEHLSNCVHLIMGSMDIEPPEQQR